jgi:hypothetical protein
MSDNNSSSSDALYAFAIKFFGDLGPLQNDMAKARTLGQVGGEQIGTGVSDGILRALRGIGGGSGMMNIIMGGTPAEMVGAGVGLALGRGIVSGLASASQSSSFLEGYERRLRMITGNAKLAGQALTVLQRQAENSNFDQESVLQAGVRAIGMTGSVSKGTAESQKLLDSAAAIGLASDKFGEFSDTVLRLDMKGDKASSPRTLFSLLQNAPGFNTQAAKILGVAPENVERRLQGMSSAQQKRLIEQIGANNTGASGKDSTLPEELNKLQTAATNAIAPTGKLINSGLTPLVGVLFKGAQAAESLNKATGGQAGLAAALGLGTVAVRLMIPPIRQAITGINELSGAIMRLAGTAEMVAAGAANAANIANAAKSAGPSLGSLAGEGAAAANAIRLAKAAKAGGGTVEEVAAGAQLAGSAFKGLTSKGGGALGKLAGMGEEVKVGAQVLNAAKFLKLAKAVGPGILSFGGDYIGGKMQESDNEGMRHAGRYLKNISGDAGWGGLGSMLLGPEAAPFGYAAGAIVGLIRSVVQDATGEGAKLDKAGSGSNMDDNTRALKDMTNVLKTGYRQIGGGSRTRFMMGVAEQEYINRSLMLGVG